jgi:hypothetical protein
MKRKQTKTANSAMKIVCITMISNRGPADSATSTRSSAIMVITRNSDRQTPEIRSDALSSVRRPANGIRFRIATPTIMHQRNDGSVSAPPANFVASHFPATTAAKIPQSAPSAPMVVIGDAAALSAVFFATVVVERSL